MFKKMTLTAACAALLSSVAHADFAPSQIEHSYISDIDAAEPYYRLPFTIPGIGLPTSFWCPVTGVGFPNGLPTSRSGQTASKVLSADGQNCEILMPKDMASGDYDVTLVFVAGGVTHSQTYRFIYTDAEPPFDDSQHANVEGVLLTHADRKIRKAGEVIRFAFNVSGLSRAIPAGDYVRTDITAADIVRPDGADSNQDFGFACDSVGAGVPVGGAFKCTGSYTVRQTDIDAEGFLLAFGAALSTRDFNLWGGNIMENFEVEKVTAPDPDDQDDDEKTACKPMPEPAGGSKFVFRYPVMSAACS